MPSGNSHARSTLTPQARKHLLLVACTLDRLDFMAQFQRPASPFGRLAQLTSLPLLETVADAAQRFLPRKIRLLLTVLKTWRRSRRAL